MLDNFLTTYQILNKYNLMRLQDIYADNVVFIDPVHEINGLDDLTKYFIGLYENIDHISFSYADTLSVENTASVYWQMTYSHPKLNKGKDIQMEGNTLLKFNADGKVIYHHDYFDLGAMIYEHVPLLGLAIGALKKRLSS